MTTIQPIGIESIIQPLQSALTQAQAPSSSFSNIFQNIVDNVQQTEAIAQNDALLVATGQSDDLHTVMIDAAKAELALSMLVQVRNKALDAYSQIMNITL